jgi:capsule polysaccharide export protein KpsE/RkpR
LKQSTQTISPPLEIPGEIRSENFRSDSPSPRRAGIDWLWILWTNRKPLAKTVLWAIALSVLVSLLIPKRYESTTRLMPPDPQSGTAMAMLAAMSGKGGAALGGMAGDLLGMKNSGDLFLEILRGRTVEDRLIDRFDLRKVYGDHYWEDARKELASRSTLAEDRKSGVITITIVDGDPQRAQALAAAYVDELDRLVAEVSTSSARRERIFIEERLKGVKSDLDAASKQFSEYASRNTTVDITAQAKAMVEGVARLEGELIAAQSELEGLEQIYTPNNVRVRSLRARIEELKRQLQKLGGDSSAPPTDTNAEGGDEKPQQFPTIRQLPLLGVRWVDLYRQTKLEETVYELLTQQYELAKIQEAKEIPVVKVLDKAIVPERKSSPHRTLIVALSAFFALIAGCAWILGSTVWRDIDPSDSRKLLAQEVAITLRARVQSWTDRWVSYRAGSKQNGL